MSPRRAGLAAALACGLAASEAGARVVERIAAVVGDELILQSEVEEKAAPFLRQLAAISDRNERAVRAEALRREVLDRLIDDELILIQARELKLTVASDEIDKSIDSIKRDNNLTDAQLMEALAAQGMTMAAYRQDVKRQILRYRVLQIAVGAKIAISDREVQSYYDRYVRGSEIEVRAAHIFLAIPPGADAGAVLEREQAAAELRRRVEAGEDFAALARSYSEDPATRDEGGDLGYFGKDLLPKAIEEVVFAMRVGEVRGPIRADRGFHVLQLIDRREKPAQPLEDLQEDIRNRLRQKVVEKETRTYLNELRGRILVDVRS